MPVEASFAGYIDEFEPVADGLNGEIYPHTDQRDQVGHLSYRHTYIPPEVKYIGARLAVSLVFTTDPSDADTDLSTDHTTATFEVDASESGIGTTLRIHEPDGEQIGLIDMPSDGVDIDFETSSHHVTVTVESRPHDNWSDEEVENSRDRTRRQFESAGLEYP